MSEAGRPSDLAFLDGGGKMGALMRVHDWSRSPLGDPRGWPEALKVSVATCLSSQFPMVIWWGPQLLMLYNDAWQPILGETKHPAGLGRPGAESWPETWSVVGVQFENALRGIGSRHEDLLLPSDRHGYLEECYFTYAHSPLKDATGKIVGVHSVVSETTAHVLNERRLRALRGLSEATVLATREVQPFGELCRALLDRLCTRNPDAPFAAMYLTDEEGRARRVAAAGTDGARFPAEAAAGEFDDWGVGRVLAERAAVATDHPRGGLPGGSWPEPTTLVVALPLSRPTAEAELVGVLLAGVNSRLRLDPPYLGYLGLVAAQLGSAVSALQLVESERQARDAAERAAGVRDDFLAILSHELRTPLNAVIGWIQILKRDLGNETRVAEAVEVIERNARVQVRLITDLLDISRIVSGNLHLDVQTVELPFVVEAAIDSVLPAAAAHNVRIDRSIAAIDAPVQGDPARIQQMIWNLLMNAVKFTPPGGRIEVELALAGRHAEIRVRDDGEGIDRDTLPVIFQRYRRAETSRSRRQGGLGLGLAIVKQLADLHGGRVRAASDGKGLGAEFVVSLPLGMPDAPQAPVADAAESVPHAGLGGLRVLAVDDEPDALSMLRRVLSDEGACVRTAASAEEALGIVAAGAFDVIVSDVGMPGLDGYDFIAEVRCRGIETPALALTAYALAEDRRKAIAAGFQAHVAKPIEPSVLVGTVGRLADRPVVRFEGGTPPRAS